MNPAESRTVTYDDILSHDHWVHRIDLGDGRYTPGVFQQDASHWEVLGLPESLDGKSVLDIGAADGLYAFEAERRGADEVCAIDLWDERPKRKRAFELAHGYLDSDVTYESANVYDLDEEFGRFDLVLLLGVIYHLRDPYLGIQNAFSVANESVVIESALSQTAQKVPVMEINSVNLDPDGDEERYSDESVTWDPNMRCLKTMTRVAGGRVVDAKEYQITEATTGTVPSIARKTVDAPATLYEDHGLQTERGTISEPVTVEVLYETDETARIKFDSDDVPGSVERALENKIHKTGWIPSDRLRPATDPDLSVGELVERARATVEKQGLVALSKKARAFVSGGAEPWRGIVRARTGADPDDDFFDRNW